MADRQTIQRHQEAIYYCTASANWVINHLINVNSTMSVDNFYIFCAIEYKQFSQALSETLIGYAVTHGFREVFPSTCTYR